MDKVRFPFRSDRHLALLHVTAMSSAWARHGLEVDYDSHIGAKEGQVGVMAQEIEFLNGNHLATYANRTRGDSWVYLAQAIDRLNLKLVTRPDTGIAGIDDLRGRRFATRGHHSGRNDWACLLRHGLDMKGGDVVPVAGGRGGEDGTTDKTISAMLLDGDADASFMTAPDTLHARRDGLRVIDIAPLPTIYSITVSTSMAYLLENPEIVERFLKGLCEGIAFFKRRRAKTLEILCRKPPLGTAGDPEALEFFYDDLAGLLNPKPYPSPDAIATTHRIAVDLDPDAARVQPLALWDFHALRKIDDSGFIDDLYVGD